MRELFQKIEILITDKCPQMNLDVNWKFFTCNTLRLIFLMPVKVSFNS